QTSPTPHASTPETSSPATNRIWPNLIREETKLLMANYNTVVKNTLALCMRTFVALVVSLFTTRIIYNALGLSDLGVYNVVGGVLVVLVILTSSLTNACQRFLAYDLGLNDAGQLRRTFGVLLTAQFILCVIIMILSETIGLWFVNNYLNIPLESMYAANWVYQVAILSMILSVIKTPFNAAILAHEKMYIYAYFILIDIFIKLLIVLALLYVPTNKLITYALLLLLSNIIDFAITCIYALKKFDETSVRPIWHPEKFKEIFFFSGWTLLGQSVLIVSEMVVNVFINWFYGTVANGAKDIAFRINNMVGNYVNQFLVALNPSIYKTYAAGELEELHKLVIRGCKLSFSIIFILSFPLIVNIGFILKIWLGSIPVYVVGFARLMLLKTIIDAITEPVARSVQATGKIKWLQIATSLVAILIIPLSYIALHLGYEPYSVYVIYVAIYAIIFVVKIIFARYMIKLNVRAMVYRVLLPCFSAMIVSYGVAYLLNIIYMPVTSLLHCAIIVVEISLAVIITYILAFNKSERGFINNLLIRSFKKLHLLKTT
ncbi:MAG: MATE family efflux transporter, partial [Muribaculum sp.]|nr:MATE family efflux transporter [Muribaculum sp.]